MLNLYINKCKEPYGGGLAIVAANNSEEAHGILTKDSDYSHRYNITDWELIEGATIFDPPRVIAEKSYVE